MTIPGRHKSSSKTRAGRSHEALKEPKYKKCPKCKNPIKPHRACSKCGEYKGRKVK